MFENILIPKRMLSHKQVASVQNAFECGWPPKGWIDKEQQIALKAVC